MAAYLIAYILHGVIYRRSFSFKAYNLPISSLTTSRIYVYVAWTSSVRVLHVEKLGYDELGHRWNQLCRHDGASPLVNKFIVEKSFISSEDSHRRYWVGHTGIPM